MTAIDPTLLRIFESEAGEGLQALQSHLLEIERGTDAADVELEEMLRLAHNLKGSARVAGLQDLGHLVHAAETRMMGWRGEAVPDADVETMFQALDLMAELIQQPEDRALNARAEVMGAVLTQAGDAEETVPGPTASTWAEPGEVPFGPQPQKTPPVAHGSRGDDTLRLPRSHVDAVRDSVTEILADAFVAQARLRALNRAMRRFTAVTLPEDVDRELADARREMRDAIQSLRPVVTKLEEGSRECEERTRSLCLVPVAGLVVHLERVVRDAARAVGRDVAVDVVGRDLNLDVQMVEALKGPLGHVLRNAVDHGIEPADEREQAGKPATGRIEIALRHQSDRIVASVRDDGRGIDTDAVRARLGRAAEGLTDDELCQAVLLPGVSTRTAATEISGRGIGLDAVTRSVEALRGSLLVQSEAGRETCVTLDLPMNLSIVQGLVVEAGGMKLVLPDGTLVALGDGDEAAVPLTQLLGLPCSAGPDDDVIVSTSSEPQVVLLRGREEPMAVQVDSIDGRAEVVRRSLGNHLGRIPFVEGATILEQGEPALILDVREALEDQTPVTPPVRVARSRVLVADDSATMRARFESDLTAAGFEVVCAADGAEALECIDAGHWDAVVSDVQMPRVDGLQLATACGKDLPVILVTAYPKDADRDLAHAAGAHDYIVKDENVGHAVVDAVLVALSSRSIP